MCFLANPTFSNLGCRNWYKVWSNNSPYLEWPLPTEDNPETLQHLMTPMTAPSKLVVGHIEILHFEKQFYDTFMRAKDIYSEFYSKFHFIQEVLDMLEMKTRGETVSKRSL